MEPEPDFSDGGFCCPNHGEQEKSDVNELYTDFLEEIDNIDQALKFIRKWFERMMTICEGEDEEDSTEQEKHHENE